MTELNNLFAKIDDRRRVSRFYLFTYLFASWATLNTISLKCMQYKWRYESVCVIGFKIFHRVDAARYKKECDIVFVEIQPFEPDRTWVFAS